jgi:hypothetical protein
MMNREEHAPSKLMHIPFSFFLIFVERILLSIRLASGFSYQTDGKQRPRDLAARLVDF